MTLHLLIVVDVSHPAQAIIETLMAAGISCTYDIVEAQSLNRHFFQESSYDVVLFYYLPPPNPKVTDLWQGSSPMKALEALQHSGQDIPFILISEPLGDEIAVECIKAGVTEYVLTENLSRLPLVLERSLVSFQQKKQEQASLEQIRQQAQQQTIINQILQAMRETLVLDDIFQKTVDLLHESLGVSRCIITQADSNGAIRITHVSQGTTNWEALLGTECKTCHYYYDELSQGEAIVFNKIESTIPARIREFIQKGNIRSFLTIPLIYQQNYLGVISLHHCDVEHEWTNAEINITNTIASQCAIAIYQAQLFAQVEQQNRREQLLNGIGKTLNSTLKPEQILQNIVQRIGETFGVDRVVLFRFNSDKISIQNEWRVNEEVPSMLGIETQLRDWPELQNSNCKMWKIGYFQKTNYPDYASQPGRGKIHADILAAQTQSVLSIPIFVKDQLFSNLGVHTTTHQRTFTEEEIRTIQQIADQAAIALDNASSYERLEQEVRERTRQLEAEKQRSEAANRAKSEFLSTMSHELRTPLTAIIGFSRMLIDEIYGTLNPKQMEYITKLSASGEHLLALVNDLLDLSKIEADREELYLETVNIEQVCQAALLLVQERAKERGLKLILDIDPCVSQCVCDQLRLKQILVNLLSNAVKFTETGSVTLKVKRDENSIKFSVIDTGIGITEANLKKLFEPFHQINNHQKHKYPGTGLGLTLSLKLARLHGGDLTVTSQLGQGSCFTLHLPA
ncbi:MAG: GAF domain-containing protein [Chroococcales cyanobacterium]